MNHDDAMEMMAAERYILGELEPAERDAFEEHFFDCTVCADDIRDSAKFAAGVRTSDAKVKHYSRWATAAAAAAVAIGLAYQYAPPQVAHLWHGTPAPVGVPVRVAGEQIIELDASRAATTAYRIRTDQAVSLRFIVPPPDQPHPPYACELRDESGRVIESKTVTEKEAADTITMPLSTTPLHRGHYTLEIRGGDREIVTTYPFTVEVR